MADKPLTVKIQNSKLTPEVIEQYGGVADFTDDRICLIDMPLEYMYTYLISGKYTLLVGTVVTPKLIEFLADMELQFFPPFNIELNKTINVAILRSEQFLNISYVIVSLPTIILQFLGGLLDKYMLTLKDEHITLGSNIPFPICGPNVKYLVSVAEQQPPSLHDMSEDMRSRYIMARTADAIENIRILTKEYEAKICNTVSA